MASFFTALLLAGISGLCFLAVQYPKIYRDQIFMKLNILTIATNAIVTAYSIGSTRTAGALYTLIPSDKSSAYHEISKSVNVPYLWVALGCIGFLLFLVVLLWLSYLIEKEKSKGPSNV